MILQLIRLVIALVQSGSALPDWTDREAVEKYLAGLAGPLAALIVYLASRQQPLPIVGEELRDAVTSEVEAQGLDLPPAVIEAIVQIILWLLRRL